MSPRMTAKRHRTLTALAAAPEGLATYDRRFAGSGDYKHLARLAELGLACRTIDGRHSGSGQQVWQITDSGRAALAGILSVLLRPDELDGGWVASVAERPGLFSQGDTAAEALRLMADLIAGEIDDSG